MELLRRLTLKDEQLTKEGLCKAGELVKHVKAAGVKAGHDADLATWGTAAIQLAIDEVRTSRRPTPAGAEGGVKGKSRGAGQSARPLPFGHRLIGAGKRRGRRSGDLGGGGGGGGGGARWGRAGGRGRAWSGWEPIWSRMRVLMASSPEADADGDAGRDAVGGDGAVGRGRGRG